MDIKSMSNCPNEIEKVADLYIELAYFLKSETQDQYFNFDEINKQHLIDQLSIVVNDPKKITYIVLQERKIIGFISGEVIDCFLPISKIKKIGYISGAYICPGYRKLGILKVLEKRIIEFFSNLEVSFIELNVISSNSLGKESWIALGYETFREQMRKKIS